MGILARGLGAGEYRRRHGTLGSSILLLSRKSIAEFISLLDKEFMLNCMQDYLGSVVSNFVTFVFLLISWF